jgi:hypothetical protein
LAILRKPILVQPLTKRFTQRRPKLLVLPLKIPMDQEVAVYCRSKWLTVNIVCDSIICLWFYNLFVIL